VNAVQGETNVQAYDVVREDQSVKTGSSSYVEVLLSPGAFLRINENSEVKIDSAGVSDIVIQVVSGTALIEDVAMDSRLPIRAIVGGAKLLIGSSGLYRFTSDTASVIDGALRLGAKDETDDQRRGEGYEKSGEGNRQDCDEDDKEGRSQEREQDEGRRSESRR